MGDIYHIKEWRIQEQRSRISLWKLFLYEISRPFISIYAKRYISQEVLAEISPDMVIFDRGFPLQSRRRWAISNFNISDKVILIQGTGTGWDVISWATFRPRKIIAVDLFQFEESWSEITSYCENTYMVPVHFRQGSLDKLDFIDDESIDFCGSDAVFEHCLNLREIMSETDRVLRPGGVVYASYGPLWYCAAGDHYARGGMQNAYNHLLLDQESYGIYFRKHLVEGEDYQSGGRYVNINLFSYLRTIDYINIFHECGFRIENLILEISTLALKYKEKFPDKFRKIQARYSGICDEDDFIIKGNFIRMRKPSHNSI